MGEIEIYTKDIIFLNLIVSTSILFISLLIFKIYNNKKFIYLSNVYFIEIVILLLSKENYKYIIIYGLVKLILINFNKKDLKIKNNLYFSIISLYLISFIIFICRNRYGLFLYIILDLIILKIFIINYIKELEIKIKNKKAKINLSKKNVSEIMNEINLERELQNQYKNELLNLNKEINIAIEKSKNAIFILNLNKDCIYTNDKFLEIMNINKSIKNIDIFSYINLKFINSHEIVDCLNDLNLTKNIKAYNGKIYKFECVRETLSQESVFICILTDITESTIIKNKLKESEERYKKLMGVLNDGVIIHNMNSINYINNKAISLFDIETNDLSIESLISNISNKSKNRLINNINSILMGKKDKITTKIETKDGKIIEFITTNIVLNDTKMLISIAIDITRLEKIITDIEQSEKMYRLLLQALPEGVVIIDKKTNDYIYRNEAMIKILKNIGVENLNNVIRKYLNKFEYGTFKKFYTNSSKIKEVDIAIIDRNEEDAFLVVVRTIDDKYKTEKMKELLDEISNKCRFKTEFLANVASDIKKPINTIFETNKILYINKEKYNSDYIDDYTRLVKQNCYRLMRLLDNIQQIGNLENKTYKMNIKKYNIVKFINDIVEKSKRYTDEKGLSIRFKSNIDEKIVAMDKDKVEKIILNLLSNSIKFTKKGGTITVLLECKKDEICISIIDTGEGIPKDKVNVIFESFEQVDRTLSRGAEGSGIGLSLVKKLLDAHDGKIEVNSEIDKGSEFKIIFKDDLYTQSELNEISSEHDLGDNEKIDIEFSDIYFNYSY